MVDSVNKIIFGLFLLAAAWEDGREKAVSVWLFQAAGIAGLILALLQGDIGIERLLSCMIGVGLLLLSRLTGEAIGMGDGWFFVVSGLFLRTFLNLKLLIYGAFLNGVVCGGIYLLGCLRGRDYKKKTIPFLPFLVPVWIGLVMI
ncbi:MAG TPA: pilus assembly protein CpaA [Lachnoclostridium sp.]|uniref:Leader peptidase (Prepilin peptidase)/N-methyltransferase n=1 Tax=[Clostridium] celerecrescens 18A TaxID=1286362 RepID=A0A2M8Z9T4_9FIRM|nr:prepilin peptidase [Lacrimispora celerecrescens]PJJ30202.1 leader peptidase (prepilin peptidase)/N-methyltransferase [[Clostridium] celerecrescens 18A]HBE86667.1 pilus assembly protein CpaA [Lachnoclostridium sp.]